MSTVMNIRRDTLRAQENVHVRIAELSLFHRLLGEDKKYDMLY